MKLFLTVAVTSFVMLFACNQAPKNENVPEASTEAEGGIPPEMMEIAALEMQRGVIYKSPEVSDGYVLYSSISGKEVFIMDKDGLIVHQWVLPSAAVSHYFTDEGHLIVSARDPQAPKYSGGGMAGRIYEYDWDGTLIWEYKMASNEMLQHHDIAPMPNGNILAIAWHEVTPEEAIASGRTPHTVPKAGLWFDKIVEIKPILPDGGEIVWEWGLLDHIVQEEFPQLPNYGVVADNPRKVYINVRDSIPEVSPEEFEQEMKMGMHAANATIDNVHSDIFHTNAINYNPKLDQIVISSPAYNEIWVVDHNLTSEEAATEKGDLLYRWGNPANYHRGDSTDRVLGGQHDVRWIPEGYPNEGKITIFNNNAMGEKGPYSQVIMLDPPLKADGTYEIPEDGPFAPSSAFWSYDANDSTDVLAPFISSAYAMENGNFLVNFGPSGKLVEVTAEGDILWEYWSPYIGDALLPDGMDPQPVGPFKFAVFRASHIPANHPALEGKQLEPLTEQPEYSTVPSM